MPVRSASTPYLLELRRTISAVAEPGPDCIVTGVPMAQRSRHMTELRLGLPRDPFLK